MTIRKSYQLRSLDGSIKINHVLRSCLSSEKNNHNNNTNEDFKPFIACLLCARLWDSLFYLYPDFQGGEYNSTEKSGMKIISF